MDGDQNRRYDNTRDGGAFRKPGIAQTCILFSITIILFIFVGYRVQSREFYSGILISEVGLIMLPALLFLIFFRFNIKAVLRLNRTRPLNFLITFGIMIFAIPLAGVFNLLNLLLVNTVFGKVMIRQAPVAQNGQELLISILVIAGSAALCEEFLFRGVIQRGFESFGAKRAILLAALLFSLMHMDFQKIFGTFLLGVLIGFIVYRTNSLYSGIFAHFTNNALAVLISYAATKLMSMFQDVGTGISEETDLSSLFSSFSDLPVQQLMIVFIIYGFLFLFIAIVFILLLYALIRSNPISRIEQRTQYAEIQGEPNQGQGISSAAKTSIALKGGLKELLWLLPGIFLIACIYYFEVYQFTGEENGIIEMARRLLGA